MGRIAFEFTQEFRATLTFKGLETLLHFGPKKRKSAFALDWLPGDRSRTSLSHANAANLVNPKRVYQIYCELGLQLRNKTSKRRVKAKLRADCHRPFGRALPFDLFFLDDGVDWLW